MVPSSTLSLSAERRRLLARMLAEAGEAGGDRRIVRRENPVEMPLSFAQERLWILQQIEPDSSAYTVPTALRLSGALNADALESALREVVRRHEALRTAFPAPDGSPRQAVLPVPAHVLERRDLSSLPDGERERHAAGLAGAESSRRFSLEEGPPFHAELLRLSADDHVLLLTVHHIAIDGWSSGILFRELSAAYAAFAEGRVPELAPPPVQYADFAAWQRERLTEEVLGAQLAFWRDALASAPELLELPLDRPRPAARAFGGGRLAVALPDEVEGAFRALARDEGATLFMALLAAWGTFLGKQSRQDDVCIGTPVAGRPRREVEDLIGFFNNTLVLRTDLSGNPTFRELLRRVRERTLGAFANQDVPFERLVDELKVERSLRHNPLFQSMFSMQNVPASPVDLPGITSRGMGSGVARSKFDLRLIAIEGGERITALLEYASELFDRDTAERMARQMGHLLGQIAAHPDARLSELSLLDDDARAAVLAIGAARADFASDDTLHGVFSAQAAARPSALALSFDGERMAYAELDARSNQLARHLRSMGVGAEVKVGLFADRGMDLVVAILAVLKAGGAYVPMDPAYPADRLQYMLEDSGAAVLLTQYELRDKLPDLPCPALYLDSDWSLIERQSPEPVDVQTTADSLAYVIYTSGSTGKPKGCEITHRNVVRLFRSTEAKFAFSADDVWTMFHSAAFDFSVWEIWGALLYGGRVVIAPFLTSREPEQFHRLMRKEGVTMLSQTPSAFRQLMQADAVSPELRALRCVVFGGEALEPGSLAEWVEKYGDERPQLVNMYGITETTVHVTYRRIRRADVQAGAKSPIGVPIADLSAYVLDATLNPVPIGVAGELCVGGAGVARGYLNRPELTAERFIDSPFVSGERLYRSGDLARWLPTGELEYLGRIDEQVKVRGFRIELGEIEAVLRRHPAVSDAVVIIGKDADGNARLVGYAAGDGVGVDELRERLRADLPEYMVPTALVVLDALPLTVNGKVDRKRLPEPDAAGAESHAFVAPTTETEAVLASIWAEVLKLERVGANDRFFDLGGHSLRATQVAARVRAQLGVEMPLRSLFESATVGEIAADLDRQLAENGGAATADVIHPAPRGAALPLSFAQERLWFMEQMEPGGNAYNMALALRLTGELDRTALERALHEIVRRHETLRTVFAQSGGAPVQVVQPAEAWAPAYADLCDAPDDDVRRLLEEESRRAFDLAAGPLFRATLVGRGERHHLLVMVTHHIASDGWSTGVLFRELSALYGAYAAGEESPLADLPVQYADFAAWQRERLSGERLDGELGYWKGALAGAPAVLELPTDRPRPAVRRYQGATRSALLPLPVLTAVYELARAEEATPFMVLLAAYDALLARYTGADDVVVGTPTAGRTRAEVEGMIGFFVSTLALRTSLSGEPTFRELVARVRETTIGAFAHQELPFDRVVEAVAPERNLSHNPVFQVAFNLQNTGAGAPRLGDLEVGFVGAERTIAKFDLTLTCVERVDGLATVVEYDTDLFDDATAERILAHFGTLLEQACARPGLRLPELSLLDDDARRQVVCDWNRTTSDYPADASIVDLFREQARARPDALAVRYGAEQLTYAELDRRSDALAVRLVTAGVGPETRVGLCAERGVGMVGGMLAILKAGGAYVPLDPAYPAERLGFMLQDAGITILLAEDGLEGIFAGSAVRTLCLVLDEPTEPIALPATAGGDALAYVIYTSGSTGRPKGIGVPHRGVVRLVRNTDYAQLTADDRVAQASNASFDAATFEVWGALLNGAALVGFERETTLTPSRFKLALRDERITTLFLTTALFNQSVREKGDVFATLTHVLFGGELVDPAVVRRCLEQGAPQRLLHVYGPTESTTYSSWQLVSAVAEDAVTVPIGRGIANTTLYVLDAWLRPVPAGVPGELFVGGDGIARGYLGRPGLSADRFIPDPFAAAPGARMYRTGDVVRWNAAGQIEFRGRVDHQVKLRGFRIELGEIESALLQQPGVNEAVVMVLGAGVERRVVGYVGGQGITPAALLDAVRVRLPDYMVPGALVVLDALPLNPNGKVDRNRLPEPDMAASEEAYAAPATPTEELLAGLWAELLRVPRVGAGDEFFALGGHSLLATRMISRVRDLFSTELPLRTLFEHGVLRDFAARVDAARQEQTRPPLPPVRPVPRSEAMPLSFAQERLWFLDRMQPGLSTYNMPLALRMTGELNVAALERALGEIVRRHESLRTVFRDTGGVPAQTVLPYAPFILPVDDVSHVAAEEREDEVRARIALEAEAPFDLATGPLIRARLLRVSAGEHALLVTMHHVASDGWSMGVFYRELTTLYAAFAQGQPSPLPELPVQYADFATWQRAALSGDELNAQAAYWRGRLAGAPALLELPTDRPRPAVATVAGDRQTVVLPLELLDQLRGVARQGDATLYMVLLAAFNVLLGRWARTDDVVVGSPIAGRTRRETEELIGFFVNTLALRTDLSGDPAFAELVGRVREATLGAYAHQEIPFEKLVEVLKVERALSYSPLFQAVFVLGNVPVEAARMPGLALRRQPTTFRLAKYDLTMTAVEARDGLAVTLEYNSDLFDASTATRMLAQFGRLLNGVAMDPAAPISALPLLDDAERAAEIARGAARASFTSEDTLHGLFAARAASTPAAPALSCDGARMTYAELDARSNQLARHLRSLGVGPEVKVALFAERGMDAVVAILATVKAGGAYVPIDPAYPADRIAHMLHDSGAAVLLTHASLRSALPSSTCPVLCLDADWPMIERQSAEPVDVQTTADSLAYVIYTSGSTGKPKGCEITHRNVVRLFRSTEEQFSFGPNDVWTMFHSTAFDFSVWEIWGALLYGGRVAVVPYLTSRDPLRFHALLRDEGVTMLSQTPSAFRQLMEADRGAPALAALRCVVFGGEALEPASLREWVDRYGDERPRLVNMYGITETTVHVTHRRIRRADVEAGARSPIGIPIADLSAYVLDGSLNPVPVGVPGELCVGGAGVARGYLHRPALTVERFVDSPFVAGERLYRSGDLARRLPGGELEYLGRIDEQVKVRGFRIELGEIEAVLLKHPAVRQAVVVVREDAPGDRRLVAYVVGDADGAALREHARGSLPEYMVPAAFVALDAVPLTGNGKTDRRALPAPEAGPRQGAAHQAPAGELEQRVAAVWGEVLGVSGIGMDDNFFDVGGNSLLVIRVQSALRAHGHEVPVVELFRCPTVRLLAEHLSAAAPAGPALDDTLLRATARRGAAALRARIRGRG